MSQRMLKLGGKYMGTPYTYSLLVNVFENFIRRSYKMISMRDMDILLVRKKKKTGKYVLLATYSPKATISACPLIF